MTPQEDETGVDTGIVPETVYFDYFSHPFSTIGIDKIHQDFF